MVKGKKPIKKEAGRKKKPIDKTKLSKNKSKAIEDTRKIHPYLLKGLDESIKGLGGFRLGSPFSDNATILNNAFDTLIPNTKAPQMKILRDMQVTMQNMNSNLEKMKNQNEKMYRDIIRISATISRLRATGEINEKTFQKLDDLIDQGMYFSGSDEFKVDDDTPDWAYSD